MVKALVQLAGASLLNALQLAVQLQQRLLRRPAAHLAAGLAPAALLRGNKAAAAAVPAALPPAVRAALSCGLCKAHTARQAGARCCALHLLAEAAGCRAQCAAIRGGNAGCRPVKDRVGMHLALLRGRQRQPVWRGCIL